MLPIQSNCPSESLPYEHMPDIIGVFLSFICGQNENYANYDLTTMANEVAMRNVPKEREKRSRYPPVEHPCTEWKEMHLSVELKYGKAITVPESWKEEDILESFDVQEAAIANQSIPSVETEVNARLTANPATISTISGFDSLLAVVSEPLEKLEINTRKRVREEERVISLDDRPWKIPRRNKDQPTNPASYAGSSCESLRPRAPPDVQCAYYSGQRLGASFTITHSIIVFIEGIVI